MNKLVLTALVLTAAATQAVAPQPQKPNVLFILTGNIGYGDLDVYFADVAFQGSSMTALQP